MDLQGDSNLKGQWMDRFQRLGDRVKALRSGGVGVESSEAGRMDRELAALESDLQRMEASPIDYFVSGSEVARRRTLLTNLGAQIASAKSSDFVGSGNQADAMRQRQKDIMKLQEGMIEDIGKGVERMSMQAHRIQDEASLHVRLLDEMDVDVEAATTGLRAEARHAEAVRLKSQTCYLYIIIAVLFTILLFLIIMGL